MKKISAIVAAVTALSGISACENAGDETAQETPSGDETSQEAPSGDESDPITADNTAQFAAVLKGTARSKEIESFVDEYRVKTVEFDGFVERVYYADYYSGPQAIVRWGVNRKSLSGPRFSLDAESAEGAPIKRGQHVSVTGLLGAYEHDDADDTIIDETRLMRVNIVDAKVVVK